MKLNPVMLGTASAISITVLWVICSVFVALSPAFMGSISVGMMHGDVAAMSFTMSWGGFFWGLFAWAICAGVAAWLIAVIYNQLLPE